MEKNDGEGRKGAFGDGTAADALQQIRKKRYVREYSVDPQRGCRTGAVFPPETDTISDRQVC